MFPPMTDIRITTATEKDLSFIVELQRRFSNQLGFLPEMAIRDYLKHKLVLIARQNDWPAGYLLGHSTSRQRAALATIVQAAVPLDAQRQSIGSHLEAAWTTMVLRDGATDTSLRVREDLEATKFWRALGYHEVHRTDGTNARRRPVLTMQRPLIV